MGHGPSYLTIFIGHIMKLKLESDNIIQIFYFCWLKTVGLHVDSLTSLCPVMAIINASPITHFSMCDAATIASYHWITPLKWSVINHSFLPENKNRQWLLSLLLMNKLMATRWNSCKFFRKTSLLWSLLGLFCLLLFVFLRHVLVLFERRTERQGVGEITQ